MRQPWMIPAAFVLILPTTLPAHAQVVAGNGNGNGNGNGSGSNNVVSNSVALHARRQAPAVIAPGLAAAGIESCLGSTSIGGAAPGFGVSIGGTTTDRGCNLRLYARTLFALGHRVAATQILCNDPDVAQALLAEGIRCRIGLGPEVQRAADPLPDSPYAPVEADSAVASDVDMVDQIRGRRRVQRRVRAARSNQPAT